MSRLYIEEVDEELAVAFVHKYHYSKILPRLTKKYLGFFRSGELQGVVTLGWGTQPLGTIRKIFPDEELTSDDYYEIGKMCFTPENNESNFGSQAMSVLIKWVKKNTDILFLYTLADGIMGKPGYVYQASNFVHIGQFWTSVYRDRETGEKMHPRSARQLHIENAEWEGKKKVFWLTHDFCEYKGIDKINGLMFRYIYPLNKKAKKMMKKIETFDHPKDNDLVFKKRVKKGRFDEIPQPEFNMDVFEHNYQRPNKRQTKLF